MHAAHSPPPPLTPRPPPPSTSSPPRYMGAVHFYPSPCPPSRFNFSYRFAFDAGRCNASFLGLGIIYFPFVLKALIHNSYSANLFASVCALLLLFTASHGGVSELRRLAAMEIFSEGKGNRINVLGATIFKHSTLVPNRAAWQARKQELGYCIWTLCSSTLVLFTPFRAVLFFSIFFLFFFFWTRFLLTRPPRCFLSTGSAKREVGM